MGMTRAAQIIQNKKFGKIFAKSQERSKGSSWFFSAD